VQIIVDAPPDPARYAVAFRRILRPGFVRIRLIGVIFTLLGLMALLAPPHDYSVGVPLIFSGLLIGLFVPIYAVRVSIRNLPLVLRQPQRFEITEQSVRVLSPLVSTEYVWGAFVTTRRLPDLLLLMLGKRHVIPVPLTGVPPQQLAELDEFLANRAFIRQ
jgi:hypothetical protein